MKRIKKHLRISETGYGNNPGIVVFSYEKNFVKIESCLIRSGSYIRLTKKQAEKVAKFLLDFVKRK